MHRLKTKRIGQITLNHRTIFGNYTEDFIMDFTNYCINKLGVKSWIKLNINRKLKLKNCAGYIETFHYDEKSFAPFFKICVSYDNKNIKSTLITIAHELTHAKQIIDGKWLINSYGYFWKNKFIIDHFQFNRLSLLDDEDIDEYNQLPWEIDAVENSYSLVEKYLRSETYQNFLNYLKSYYINLDKYTNL